MLVVIKNTHGRYQAEQEIQRQQQQAAATVAWQEEQEKYRRYVIVTITLQVLLLSVPSCHAAPMHTHMCGCM